ncbi:methyltransferase [Sphaerisporangium corydalis]|uniref:Methyltransferase n=1 Tax=Sphaerisporangium corydalis TaxID=1441875 RepID=A0ABV9EVM3_9ACTN|nr:methyltransferase [Sphaerisporangium corydalis]
MTDPGTVVWDVLRGGWRVSAMKTMVDLNCADHLSDGPLSVSELASLCGAHGPSLNRVLRTLAGMGLVESVGQDTYKLTEAGAMLVTGAPGSLRSAVIANTDPTMSYAMTELSQTVRTGRSAFVERYGILYDYLSHNAELGRTFNDFMTNRAIPMAEGVAGLYDFSSVSTLMDVGGGRGHILAAALRANPHLRGVLFELEHVLPDAREAFESWGLADRCEFVSGDFFSSIPSGADAYLMGSVIHNWDDTDASRILRTARAAMGENGRLLLVEIVVPDDDTPHFGKDLDMRMLGLFGQGRERSRSEHTVLIEKAGMSVTDVLPLRFNASLIEARPR